MSVFTASSATARDASAAKATAAALVGDTWRWPDTGTRRRVRWPGCCPGPAGVWGDDGDGDTRPLGSVGDAGCCTRRRDGLGPWRRLELPPRTGDAPLPSAALLSPPWLSTPPGRRAADPAPHTADRAACGCSCSSSNDRGDTTSFSSVTCSASSESTRDASSSSTDVAGAGPEPLEVDPSPPAAPSVVHTSGMAGPCTGHAHPASFAHALSAPGAAAAARVVASNAAASRWWA